jgi:CubicO group peptidase (beta-lactamase class C family)
MRYRSAALRIVSIVVIGAAVAQLSATEAGAASQPPERSVEPRITAIEHGLAPWIELENMPTASWTLTERMKFWRVPAVSVAVIDGYRVAWARAWGVTEPNGTIPATTKTLFQAGSISKAVGAMGVMHLVQDGKLHLDGNVNDQLTSWKIHDNKFTAS